MSDELATAQYRLARAQSERRRLEKRAGKAATDYDAVLTEQGEAIDFFSAGNYGDYSVEEQTRAARRIARLGDMLLAADKLQAARIVESSMRKARDDLK